MTSSCRRYAETEAAIQHFDAGSSPLKSRRQTFCLLLVAGSRAVPADVFSGESLRHVAGFEAVI